MGPFDPFNLRIAEYRRSEREFETDSHLEHTLPTYALNIKRYRETLSTDADAAQYPPYEYEQLQEHEIRLLSLSFEWTYKGGRILKGSLSTLSQRPSLHYTARPKVRSRYEALSYAWGPTYQDGSHLTHYILCDQARLSVTEILWRALIHLLQSIAERENSSSLVLQIWIDAICIDQRNLAERAAQVAKMDRIFARASKITVWLGEATPGDLRKQRAKIPLVNSTRWRI